jgi:hypothetical protein
MDPSLEKKRNKQKGKKGIEREMQKGIHKKTERITEIKRA